MASAIWNNIFNDDDDQLTFDYNNMNTTTPLTSVLGTDISTVSVTGPSYSYGGTLSTSLSPNVTWVNNTLTSTASPYTVTIGDNYANTWGYNKALKVDGDAEISGDLKLNGVNLSERLDDIEKRLGILRPNNDLEGKWEKLKALGEEYRKLEKELLEGEAIWDTLKK